MSNRDDFDDIPDADKLKNALMAAGRALAAAEYYRVHGRVIARGTHWSSTNIEGLFLRLDAAAKQERTLKKMIEDLEERLTIAKDYIRFVDSNADFNEIYKEARLNPNARELAMAQSKGEFTMAVARYADRINVSTAQARERLKAALGLPITVKRPKNRTRKS